MVHSKIETNQTLGNLVSHQIGRARVFEWYGLDYCCGGGKSLAESCSEKGIDSVKVISELIKSDEAENKTVEVDWQALPVNKLIDEIISTHHNYLKLELPRLTYLTEKIASAHGDNHPALHEVKTVFARLRAELETHLKEEEESVFPTLRLLNSGGDFTMLTDTARGNIQKMEEEHIVVGAMLARLSSLTDGYHMPADGCETYRVALHGLMTLEQDTHLHVHKENNLLFPKAMKEAV